MNAGGFVLGSLALLVLAALATPVAAGDDSPQPGLSWALGLTSMTGTNSSLAGGFKLDLNLGNDSFRVQLKTDLHYVIETDQSRTVSQDEELDWSVQGALGHGWSIGFDGKIERCEPDGPPLRASAGPSVRRAWEYAQGRAWAQGVSLRREVQDPDTESPHSWRTVLVPQSLLRIPISKQVTLVDNLRSSFPWRISPGTASSTRSPWTCKSAGRSPSRSRSTTSTRATPSPTGSTRTF